jgi:hypothetical protein
MKADEAAKISRELSHKIAPLLIGQDPAVQSAVLADMTARWIAGHFVRDNAAATKQLRQLLLNEHVKLIQQLIPINESIIFLDNSTKH